MSKQLTTANTFEEDNPELRRQLPLVVAYKSVMRPGAEVGLVGRPDGRKKNPEEIEISRQENLTQKVIPLLPGSKMGGHITEIGVINPLAREAIFFQGDAVAAEFVRYLTRVAPWPWPTGAIRGYSDAPVALYGVNLKPLARVVGVEASLAGETVPRSLWYANDAVLDPYEMLVESDLRDNMPHAYVLARVGLADKYPSYRPGLSVRDDLRVTLELALAFRLFSLGSTGEADNRSVLDLVENVGDPAEPVKKPAGKSTKK